MFLTQGFIGTYMEMKQWQFVKCNLNSGLETCDVLIVKIIQLGNVMTISNIIIDGLFFGEVHFYRVGK